MKMGNQKEYLHKKAAWLRKEALRLHKIAPETRIASSLSCVEILAALYYGKILNVDPRDPFSEKRDRFIISKGHASVAMYPLLADLGFFPKKELKKVCKEGHFLGSIPDPAVPGYETINGSLGHGLGVACGVALGLKKKGSKSKVFVLSGDGELYEGSVWEAVMFAAHHALGNLILIIDNNKVCMLDYCKNIIDLEPIKEKFAVFGWDSYEIDGHNVQKVSRSLGWLKTSNSFKPKVIIAHTVKGKGVRRLECDPLSHIKILSKKEIDCVIAESG